MPLLVPRDAHDAVADVVVHAHDVGVLVMREIVRVLPARRRAGVVPLPVARMNFRVVHPVPLAVNDVVPEFHVFDDLAGAEQRGPEQPGRLLPAREQHDAAGHHQAALQRDGALDVPRVLLTPLGLDVASDLVELFAERLDVGIGEMCVLLDVCDGHSVSPYRFSPCRRTGPSGGTPGSRCGNVSPDIHVRLHAIYAKVDIREPRKQDHHPHRYRERLAGSPTTRLGGVRFSPVSRGQRTDEGALQARGHHPRRRR